MKDFYLPNLTNSKLLLALLAILGLSSCGTYQSAYNDDDGIYNSSSNIKVVSNDEVSSNGSDYFSVSYEEYREISNEDLITNVDDFQYTDDQYIESDSIQNNSNSSPWGYSDNTSVNIYLGNNFGFGGFQNFNRPFGFGYNYPFIGFNNSWRFGGVNYAYNNPYGFFYDIYCQSYYNNFGRFNAFGGFNNFYYGRNFYGRNNYFRNYDSYGSRTAYNTRSNINRRQVSSRVNSNTSSRTRRTIGTNTQRTSTRRTPSNTTRSNSRSVNNTTRSSSNNSSTRTTRTPSTRSSSTRSSSRPKTTTRTTRRRR